MSLEAKRSKIEDMKDDYSPNQDTEITIEYLNNDCLIHIFTFLSVQNKLKMELVCKRWCEVVKRSWFHVTNLDLCQNLPFYDSSVLKKNKTYVRNALIRCGPYLQNLSISSRCYYDEFNLIEFSKMLLINCRNVIHLTIEDYSDCLKDKHIMLLLKCFKNLESLTLCYLDLEGDFFKNLLHKNSSHKLRKLSINNCKFEDHEYLNDFLTETENLYNLKITDHEYFDLDELLEEISIDNCKNLSEISIEVIPICMYKAKEGFPCLWSVSKFISQQTKITKFKLNGTLIKRGVIESLPVTLEDLNLNESYLEDENILYNLNRFINLKIIDITLGNINYNCLNAIRNSLNKNIKEISISYSNLKLDCKKSIDCFRKFKNLESFSIYGNLRYGYNPKSTIDNILEDLSNCKEIKKIVIFDCNFTNLGLQSINSLPNLKRLEIVYNNPLNDEHYKEFVKYSLSLKELIISGKNKYKLEYKSFV